MNAVQQQTSLTVTHTDLTLSHLPVDINIMIITEMIIKKEKSW